VRYSRQVHTFYKYRPIEGIFSKKGKEHMTALMAKEAAELLGVPKQRMRELMARGCISFQRYGRSVMVDPEIARAELEACGFYARSAKWRATRAMRIKARELASRTSNANC
jgi:excisionase family DNA binding protein